MSLARKCVRSLKQDGLWGFFLKAGRRIGEAAFQTNSADWYCADLSADLPEGPALDGASVDFHAFQEACDWLRELAKSFRWTYKEKELQAARRYSHVYPLLRVGGRKAGYVKVAFRRAYVVDFDREIEIPAGAAFIYDTFVHPDYRGWGLGTFMVREVLIFLRKRGLKQLWCHIPHWNQPSIRTFTRCGFVRAKHVRYLSLLGWRLYTRNPERLMASAAGAPG